MMSRRAKGVPLASLYSDPERTTRFRLQFPYGFIDNAGGHRFWRAGEAVEAEEDLALLRGRGVVLEQET